MVRLELYFYRESESAETGAHEVVDTLHVCAGGGCKLGIVGSLAVEEEEVFTYE